MSYTISEKESKLLNIIKLFSIILVLYIHSFSSIEYTFESNNIMFNTIQLIEYVITQVIARAGVPLFFLISSILLYRKDFTFEENLKKKIKRILIPYIICNSIWILIFYVFQNFDIFSKFFTNNENTIKSWNAFNWIDAYIPIFYRTKPFVYPLWFLKDLFILNLFAKIIKMLIDRIPKAFLAFLIIMWLLNINLMIIEIQSLLFFSLGYYIVKYNIRFKKVDKINVIVFSVLYFLLAFGIAYVEISGKKLAFIHNSFIIISMLYVYIIASKCIKMAENKTGMILIRNSYFIYLFHEWNLLFVKKILDKLIGNNYIIDLIKYCFLPIIIIILCLIISETWKRINKKTYQIVTGEW